MSLTNKRTRHNIPCDWHTELAKGNVPGHTSVIIRGHNASVAAAAGFVDIAEQGDLTYITSAGTLTIHASATSDSAAGTGLRTVFLQGIGASGEAVSEVIALDGPTRVPTTQIYLRMNTMIGLAVGDSGWNDSAIYATQASGSTIQSQMDAQESISQGSHYTVPTGNTFVLTQVELNLGKAGGGQSPEVEFKGYFRASVGAAWIQGFDKKIDEALQGELSIYLPVPTQFQAKTEVRLRADTDQDATEVRSRMYGILVADGY